MKKDFFFKSLLKSKFSRAASLVFYHSFQHDKKKEWKNLATRKDEVLSRGGKKTSLITL